MTPHDLELKRYNDIMRYLDELKEYAIHNSNGVTEPGYASAFESIGMKAEFIKHMFRKYAERQHD